MIVFDSSTLILLARIDVLDLFLSSFEGDVLIPEKVKVEVLRAGKEDAESINTYIESNKIRVVKVKSEAIVKKLMDDFSIDIGEAEALTLATEKKAGIVATDDRSAIRACKLLKLEFVTAVSFLIRAEEKRLISKDEGIMKLKRLQSIGRYSKQILDDAARRIQGG
jgi:predicted nucleic acid-binding protein